MSDVVENEDLTVKYKRLADKREKLLNSKVKIEAELSARKRALKEALDEARSLGFNPDTLSDDIKKMKEVLFVKLNMLEADLNEAEQKITPLLAKLND